MELAFFGSSRVFGIAGIGLIVFGRLTRQRAGARMDGAEVIQQHLTHIREQEKRSVEAAEWRRQDLLTAKQAQHHCAMMKHITRNS